MNEVISCVSVIQYSKENISKIPLVNVEAVVAYDLPITYSGVLYLFVCTFKIHISSHTLSHITVYLHLLRRRRQHPHTKSRKENDAKTTTIKITVDFFEESIEISGELRRKTTKHKNVYTTI